MDDGKGAYSLDGNLNTYGYRNFPMSDVGVALPRTLVFWVNPKTNVASYYLGYGSYTSNNLWYVRNNPGGGWVKGTGEKLFHYHGELPEQLEGVHFNFMEV